MYGTLKILEVYQFKVDLSNTMLNTKAYKIAFY